MLQKLIEIDNEFIKIQEEQDRLNKCLIQKEKVLYQFREHRNSDEELFHVEMTYVDKDCNWTARKILDSVKEVRNILEKILEDTREDNYNLAQELEQFRQDENIEI